MQVVDELNAYVDFISEYRDGKLIHLASS